MTVTKERKRLKDNNEGFKMRHLLLIIALVGCNQVPKDNEYVPSPPEIERSYQQHSDPEGYRGSGR